MPVEIQKLTTAVEKAKANSGKRAFTQAVDLIVKLRDIDIKKPENKINELIELPNPFGKPVKICVIASGTLSVNAKKAAADLVLEKEDLEKISKDKKAAKKLANDYDLFIAEAPLMPIVGKTLGAVLGPRGKMPTHIPPNAQIEPILARHRKMVRVRTRDQPIIQCRVGTEDLPNEKIADNAQVVLTRLEEKLENGLKNVKEVHIKTTMGQLVKIEF